MKVELRAAFGYDADAVSVETGLACDPAESLTQQAHADDCDINTIVRRFGLTGELPQSLNMPAYGDFTGVVDYHSALELVRHAESEFMQLPAELRVRFAHDPAQLMRFLDDERNRDEAVKLGLIKAPVEKDREGGSV